MSAMEEIRERKLQPIYHALESGNWRQAVRLCEKRDVEKWLTTRALKANGLWRLGRYDEGMRLCLDVQAARPTEEDTLAAMSYNYRMMNRREHIAPMFEAAVQAKPGDPAVLKELFMAYVKAKEYLKAQQTATKLYKVDAKGGKFIIWAAATMLIQAERQDSSVGPMTLPLAEKMTLKVLKEKAAKGSRPVGEELRLYLDILNLQSKHRESLEALGKFEPVSTGDDGGVEQSGVVVEDESSLEDGTIVNMQEVDRLELKADLYAKLGGEDDLRQAEEVLHGLVRRSPDQWSYYVSLLDVLDKRNGLSGAGEPETDWPESLTVALKLIRQMQAENSRLRGPFLAEMEVLKRCIGWFGSTFVLPDLGLARTQQINGNAGAGDFVSEVEDDGMLWGLLCGCIGRYMAVFSAKLCCFADMRPYLAVFAMGRQGDSGPSSEGLTNGLKWLEVFFKREAAESKMSLDDSMDGAAQAESLDQAKREVGAKRLHRHICASQSRHLLGDYTASSTARSGNDDAVRDTRDTSAAVKEGQYREVVTELTTEYRATLHLNVGSEGGQREVQHGDELILMAGRTLLRLCSLVDVPRTDSDSDGQCPRVKGYLLRVEAACLLEAAISCSPYNYHLKILAIEVYRQLGSFARGLTIFGDLDVKQIQVDTLSHLILAPSHQYGLFGEVQGQCKGIKGVHRNCRNETAEHVARAFDRGNYSKGAEIDRFQREKLDLSLQLAMADAEKVTMDIILDHQSYPSAARFLQEEASPSGGGGATFPGDTWLEKLVENMDSSVQLDRCLLISPDSARLGVESRRRHLKASLKRRLLANQTMLFALRGDSSSVVDGTAKELEVSVLESATAKLQTERAGTSLEEVTTSLATLNTSDSHESVWTIPWDLLADTARALALTHHGLGKAGKPEDTVSLEAAAEAMKRGAERARACKGMLAERPRHVCALEGGDQKVYQAEAPLRAEWLRCVSKTLADGGVYTCVLLQAIGAELPADKKKKGGKGKGKGKGRKGAAGGPAVEGAVASASVLRVQEALSIFGWEVSELLRTMSAALKSEISAKLEPAHPGEALTQLLKGQLGAQYKAAVDILWDDTTEQWCKEDVVENAIVGITGGQAVCCQRLLSVVTENLAMLQRWEKKGG